MIFQAPPTRSATCRDRFVQWTPFQAINEPDREFTSSCEVTRAEPYRMKAQVECNFEKVRAAANNMQIISSETLNMRTWSSGLYQFFIGNTFSSEDYELHGDDVRGVSLFLSEGDCTEGEYMDILVEQVKIAIS
jgi:hypothetical protein